jgi:hypothetical protein
MTCEVDRLAVELQAQVASLDADSSKRLRGPLQREAAARAQKELAALKGITATSAPAPSSAREPDALERTRFELASRLGLLGGAKSVGPVQCVRTRRAGHPTPPLTSSLAELRPSRGR